MPPAGRPKGSRVARRLIVSNWYQRRRKTEDTDEPEEHLSGPAADALEQARTDFRVECETFSLPRLLEFPPERFSDMHLAHLLWTEDYIPLLLLELRQHPNLAVRR